MVTVLLALAYGPYHSPTLGQNVTATVDVARAAANGELGFDDVTMETAPSPKPTEASPFSVLSRFFCTHISVACRLIIYHYTGVKTTTTTCSVAQDSQGELVPETNVLSKLAKGRIADLSLLAVANSFVRS